VESTYGNRCHPKEDREKKLADIVNQVYQRGGTLVIPAFAVGRTQELLFLLTQLESEKRIPKIPKYLDSPMAKHTTQIYLRHISELRKNKTATDLTTEDMLKSLSGEGFYFVGSSEDSRQICENKDPKIVIAASGMLQGGRILHHLKRTLPDPKNAVLFVGYQGEGTKGALLKNGINRLRIHHELIDVRASIFSIEGFSAHADSQEILSWLSKLEKAPQLTLVNHGEPAASSALTYRIKTELNWTAQAPHYQEEIGS
jgi:metallo-beta-lactamase family protein